MTSYTNIGGGLGTFACSGFALSAVSSVTISFGSDSNHTENIRTNYSSETCRLLVAESCLCKLSIHKRRRCCRCSCLITELNCYIMTDSQSASLSWYPYEAYDQILLLSDTCGFVHMGCPLRREDGSVFYNYCCLRQQSFSGPSPAGLMTTFYCLRFETPPTWRTRSLYLYPPGIGWPGYTPRHWVYSLTAAPLKLR
jgi:hypothetical protein